MDYDINNQSHDPDVLIKIEIIDDDDDDGDNDNWGKNLIAKEERGQNNNDSNNDGVETQGENCLQKGIHIMF